MPLNLECAQKILLGYKKKPIRKILKRACRAQVSKQDKDSSPLFKVPHYSKVPNSYR